MRFLLPLAIMGLFATGNVWAAPVVTPDASNLAANATTLTIAGSNFDSVTPGNNVVTFNNGATGTVTAATTTTLTVTSLTALTVGTFLTAVVTNGGGNSGVAVTVATVVAASTPTVTMNSAQLGSDVLGIVINGTGFDTTASSNSVTFDNGAVGTVSIATSTQLNVAFSVQPGLGALNAIVTTDGVSSVAPVQVATVVNPPTVTMNTANLAMNASGIVINGTDFDPIPSNNMVIFDNGAGGTVMAATPTSLTVTFTPPPTGTGPLSAVVGCSGTTSGLAMQVATVVAASTPTVTMNNSNLAANATMLTINGNGFDLTPTNNTVAFNGGATGTVMTATATSLTVTPLSGLTVGSLTAVVTTNGVDSVAPVQVATVIPVVTSSIANLPANATTLTINGFGFNATAGMNTVAFSGGATGTVAVATATSLTVNSLAGLTPGSLTAVVTTSSVGSGAAVQVATVVPVVTASTANRASNATTLTINGFGFSATAGNNAVAFNGGATGTVTAATATSLTVTSLAGLTLGSLNAVVTTDGVSSGTPVQVATVVNPPVVTANTANLSATAASIVITGGNFDPTAANDTVVFNDGAVGAVTTASATSLTVTFSIKPTSAGNLTAIVTTNGISSGAAVQVANVTQAVTAAPTTTLLISSLNPSLVNTAVTFGARVTATGATPAGSVVFTIDGTAQAPVTLDATGAATSNFTFAAAKTVAVTAAFTPGTTAFLASASNAFMQVVNTQSQPGGFASGPAPKPKDKPAKLDIIGLPDGSGGVTTFVYCTAGSATLNPVTTSQVGIVSGAIPLLMVNTVVAGVTTTPVNVSVTVTTKTDLKTAQTTFKLASSGYETQVTVGKTSVTYKSTIKNPDGSKSTGSFTTTLTGIVTKDAWKTARKTDKFSASWSETVAKGKISVKQSFVSGSTTASFSASLVNGSTSKASLKVGKTSFVGSGIYDPKTGVISFTGTPKGGGGAATFKYDPGAAGGATQTVVETKGGAAGTPITHSMPNGAPNPTTPDGRIVMQDMPPSGAAAVIASVLTASGSVGAPFTYTIAVTGGPTSFNATGLPPGLSVDKSSGKITGTPTDASGSPYTVIISATNTTATTQAFLVITISP